MFNVSTKPVYLMFMVALVGSWVINASLSLGVSPALSMFFSLAAGYMTIFIILRSWSDSPKATSFPLAQPSYQSTNKILNN